MKTFRVTLKTTYEVDATDVLEAENAARAQMKKDGIDSLATAVSEVKPKVVVDDEGD